MHEVMIDRVASCKSQPRQSSIMEARRLAPKTSARLIYLIEYASLPTPSNVTEAPASRNRIHVHVIRLHSESN